jgi:hypothetical protein
MIFHSNGNVLETGTMLFQQLDLRDAYVTVFLGKQVDYIPEDDIVFEACCAHCNRYALRSRPHI